MKTEAQRSPELDQLRALIEPIAVAMLTHLDADGALVSRPVAPLEMDASGALWFFADRRSADVELLRVVNLNFSDSARSTYVSLSGSGEMYCDRARIERLWTSFARPWFPEGPESADLVLLKVVPDTAEYWDAPDSKMVRLFVMASSMLAGKPIGLVERDSLTRRSGLSPASTAG
ncbi:pyridoxamine 5'-phosphate oxidase family protein [Rivibacter subsaxonicus]|uniref:General stress protein 26 n=1 Tax=Rivibacter subsaxonicus TaxID=457575 RepID=A0A4Q7W1K9_9BURK|nr:pyridoxamine 5'-phosphate oxidase family protein [Rivibacter subsaxonicus]RZU03131.1 general stress protein 26 [Rivibacter subsaxonicus]